MLTIVSIVLLRAFNQIPPMLTWDSFGYISMIEVLDGSAPPSHWDTLRGPGFPIFLYLISLVSAHLSSGYITTMSLLWLATLLMFGGLLRYAVHSDFRSSFTTNLVVLATIILLAIDPSILGYYHTILTEGISCVGILSVVVLGFALRHTLNKESYISATVIVFIYGILMTILYAIKQPLLAAPLAILIPIPFLIQNQSVSFFRKILVCWFIPFIVLAVAVGIINKIMLPFVESSIAQNSASLRRTAPYVIARLIVVGATREFYNDYTSPLGWSVSEPEGQSIIKEQRVVDPQSLLDTTPCQRLISLTSKISKESVYYVWNCEHPIPGVIELMKKMIRHQPYLLLKNYWQALYELMGFDKSPINDSRENLTIAYRILDLERINSNVYPTPGAPAAWEKIREEFTSSALRHNWLSKTSLSIAPYREAIYPWMYLLSLVSCIVAIMLFLYPYTRTHLAQSSAFFISFLCSLVVASHSAAYIILGSPLDRYMQPVFLPSVLSIAVLAVQATSRLLSRSR